MDQSSSSIWEDWGDLLDFTVDPSDPFFLPTLPPPLLPPPPSSEVDETSSKVDKPMASKVRKRDPRLVCENYLAGRVPCACPELDAMMLEQEDEEKEKRKRVRIRVRDGEKKDPVRCQVVGCEVDIGELKGYHKRHKVCLKCANAERVLMDGEEKRYCQQCGKFHILPDFDEGKRSCRRKLERHNRRRRRKPTDDTSLIEDKGSNQADKSTEATYDVERNDENGFASETVICSRLNDADILVESDDHASPVSPIPNSQNFQSNGDASFANPGEAYTNEGKDKTKLGVSTTGCDNISTYSSLCPTGRISFKLYDWNPAEFPRRLRHQIFQWLASMPVELEGYVRPGCTILTIFIAMPQLMWDKLSQDAAVYIKDLINAPESSLLGRKNIFIFLSNTIIQVLKDGSSLVNIKMEVKAPMIHYVYPTFFEAGKPIELVICGSNLIQPKFRFLVSFAGKYMAYDSCEMSHGTITSCDGNEDSFCHGSNHDMLRIHLGQMESKVFGPAFVEVENESGISNFIPILIGNKKICSELERLQVSFGGLAAQISVLEANPDLCELIARKQTTVSELLLDIAWLLKEPSAESTETYLTAINLQRLISVLKIIMHYELFGVMELVLNYLDAMFCKTKVSENVAPDADLKSFEEHVNNAKQMLGRRELGDLTPKTELIISKQLDANPREYAVSARNQDGESKSEYCTCSPASCTIFTDENTQLISPRRTHKKRDNPYVHVDWSRNQWTHKISGTRLMLYVMVSIVMCVGACTVLLHPLNPGEIAVSIRRCLFGYRSP